MAILKQKFIAHIESDMREKTSLVVESQEYGQGIDGFVIITQYYTDQEKEFETARQEKIIISKKASAQLMLLLQKLNF
jgi:hypothetical protein